VNCDSSIEDLHNLEQILMRVDNLENTASLPVLGKPTITKESDSNEGNNKLIKVHSTDKQLTSSSNSLKPIMRG